MTSWVRKDDAPKDDRPHRDPAVLKCVECGKRTLSAARWRGVRVDLPNEGDDPALALYCPECAERESGDR